MLQPKLLSGAIALALSTSSLVTYAKQTPSELAEINVTANRSARTVDDTLVPVTIINKEDIKRLQASSVPELLQITPSISFTSNGGFGSTSGVSLRGTNTDHVLYLIDGVPLGSATLGTTAIEYLPISQVERIEIIRGPRSSLYGSDAIGGVIQIFTTKQAKKSATASIGLGSDSSKEITASYADSNETSSFGGGLSLFKTDGYDFYGRDSYGTINPGDDDDDGYENYSLSLNASHKFTDQLSLSGLFLRSQGESEFDAYSDKNTHTRFIDQVLSGSLAYQITEDWDSKLTLSQSYDKQYNSNHDLGSSNNYFVDPKSHFNTKTNLLNWQNDIALRDSADLLTLGVDYKNDKVDSSTDYSEQSRWNKALYAQYLYSGDVFDSQLSYRFDDNEAFGSHSTWGIGTGFNLDKNVRITTSYGTAFKAPTFNDLYWPADAFFSGNPNLKPEESESFDFGVDITTGQTLWSAHYFLTKVDNLITYVSAYPAISMMENVSKANIDGFELGVTTNLYGWQLGANLSLINPVDEQTGLMLPRRSKRNINISLDKTSGALSYGVSLIASSRRYNKTDEREELAGYGIMNIRASWQFTKHWSVKAKVDNLFDKQYVLTKQGGYQYNQPDRFIFTSLHYEM